MSASDLFYCYHWIVANEPGHHQCEVYLDNMLHDQGLGLLQIHSLENIPDFQQISLYKGDGH